MQSVKLQIITLKNKLRNKAQINRRYQINQTWCILDDIRIRAGPPGPWCLVLIVQPSDWTFWDLRGINAALPFLFSDEFQ